MAHSAEIQRFLGGTETRQLFALDRRSGRIVELRDGCAREFRPDCHAGHLVCPIECCENRMFTTVGGSKRHHFRHRVPGARAHGRESYYHQLGKILLGQNLGETAIPKRGSSSIGRRLTTPSDRTSSSSSRTAAASHSSSSTRHSA